MDANEILKQKNLKITPQREALLEIMLENHIALDANKIFSLVLEVLPGTNFSTVYRNLDTLVSKKILCQISRGNNGDLYKLREDEEHHHHIICSRCGMVISIDFCPMAILEKKLKEQGFTPESHSFKVYGICKDCRETD